jgi:hypothetical protein
MANEKLQAAIEASAARVEAEAPDAVREKEAPSGFSIADVLGDEAAINSLVKRVNNIIERKRLKLADFGPMANEPVFGFRFPAKEEGQVSTRAFFDGYAALTVLTDYNSLNRPAALGDILRYCVDIVTGEWNDKTHEGVAFSWEPISLLDGQHRFIALYLASLVNPAVRVKLLVFFNCDPDTRDKINIGRNRSAADKMVMNLKADGDESLQFKNDQINGISSKQIFATVSSMPSRKSCTEQEKVAFAQQNVHLIAEMVSILKSTPKMLRFSAAWAGPFVDAAFVFGKEAIIPLAKRFAKNDWVQYGDDNRVDPLFGLYNKLVSNATANKTHKLTGPTIGLCTVYAIRKALLGTSVPLKSGSRHYARYPRFTEEEARDFQMHGAKSRILADYSIARQESRKKELSEGDIKDLIGDDPNE